MRILYPKPGAQKIQSTTSRMGDVEAKEGDIPYYALWDDGSEYEVFEEGPGMYVRRFHGPQFDLALGEWKTERF